jgi:dihydropteroate synthase
MARTDPPQAGRVKLCLRDRVLELEAGRALIMGIVNIGDDSVADGTHLQSLDEQLRFASAQIAAGAQIIDIGVQSGRTDTAEISQARELERLEPLVSELAAKGVLVSVDTWRPRVAAGAVAAGACLINDTSGLADTALAEVAAESGAGLVLMHTRAKPKQKRFPQYTDPTIDVLEFLGERIELAISLGVASEQLIVDPGPDFAKTPSQTIEVLRRLSELTSLERPILLAVSRKYFIGMLSGKAPEDRLAGTLAAIGHGLECGASIVRVHDVAATAEFLLVGAALRDVGPVHFKGQMSDERLKWIASKRPSRRLSDT